MSAGIFDKGRAAFNPVPIIVVEDAADPFDRRMMNMTAHDAVRAVQELLHKIDTGTRAIYIPGNRDEARMSPIG